jgi:hypothetical protein
MGSPFFFYKYLFWCCYFFDKYLFWCCYIFPPFFYLFIFDCFTIQNKFIHPFAFCSPPKMTLDLWWTLYWVLEPMIKGYILIIDLHLAEFRLHACVYVWVCLFVWVGWLDWCWFWNGREHICNGLLRRVSVCVSELTVRMCHTGTYM